ncbi:MAG: acyl-CoA dehydrogenase family protein, partial [Burkholderiales bacterium]
MSAVLDTPLAAPIGTTEAMLAAVREIADGALAELADDIDRRGVYPKGVLMRLGEVGAFKAHLALGSEPDYGAAIQAITEVSRVCGATGFMMWCH